MVHITGGQAIGKEDQQHSTGAKLSDISDLVTKLLSSNTGLMGLCRSELRDQSIRNPKKTYSDGTLASCPPSQRIEERYARQSSHTHSIYQQMLSLRASRRYGLCHERLERRDSSISSENLEPSHRNRRQVVRAGFGLKIWKVSVCESKVHPEMTFGSSRFSSIPPTRMRGDTCTGGWEIADMSLMAVASDFKQATNPKLFQFPGSPQLSRADIRRPDKAVC